MHYWPCGYSRERLAGLEFQVAMRRACQLFYFVILLRQVERPGRVLVVILLANVLEDSRFVVQSSKLLPAGTSFDEVADWFLVLNTPPFDETLRHFPSRLDVL